jgi:beta-glucosidase
LTAPVTNTGDRKGSEVVQCYVASRAPRLARPPKELKAFAKVTLDPGAAATVTLVLDARAFAYWDPGDPHFAAASANASSAVPAGTGAPHRTQPGWYADPGEYDVWIGRTSADLGHVVTITLDGERAS